MKITDDQLRQIIKEEVMANEGLMDFLRDPTGRKARAKIADLEKQVAQASSEAEKLKAEKEKAALEKAAEEKGLLDNARADYAQAEKDQFKAKEERTKQFEAAVQRLVPGTRNYIDDFLERREHYFDLVQTEAALKRNLFPKSVYGDPAKMVLNNRTLRKYGFVRAPQKVEANTALRISQTLASNRGRVEGSTDKRLKDLFGPAGLYNRNEGNILIVDPQSGVYVSYADFRQRRYKGELNQRALLRAIINDLEDRGYKRNTDFSVPMSPENRAARGVSPLDTGFEDR